MARIATTVPSMVTASERVNGRITAGSVAIRPLSRWRCGQSSAAMTAPNSATLASPLAKLASACFESSQTATGLWYFMLLIQLVN